MKELEELIEDAAEITREETRGAFTPTHCPKCKAETVMMDNRENWFFEKGDLFIPAECGHCGLEFDIVYGASHAFVDEADAAEHRSYYD